MTDDNPGGQEPSRDRRTLPAITDFGCWTLSCVGAVVALIVVVVVLS